jgi:hypothetical protein
MFILLESFYTPLARYCIEQLQPVHEVRVDGAPVMQIFRLTQADAPLLQQYQEKYRETEPQDE